MWTGRLAEDLRARIAALPGFGEMKVKALASVLAKRYGVALAEPLVPSHPTLGRRGLPQALRSTRRPSAPTRPASAPASRSPGEAGASREWRRDVSGVAAARATTERWPTMRVAVRARVIAV